MFSFLEDNIVMVIIVMDNASPHSVETEKVHKTWWKKTEMIEWCCRKVNKSITIKWQKNDIINIVKRWET